MDLFDIQKMDVKIFTLTTGLEILARVKEVSNDLYVVEDAFGIQSFPQTDESGRTIGTNIGFGVLSVFAQATTPTGAIPGVIHKCVVFNVIDPPEELATQYSTITGHVIAAKKAKIQMPR